jgi:hypothetical protein
MRFSKAFSLSKSQAELDFVDIDLEGDTPLYVDPFALSIRKDAWSMRCTQHIVSFFQTAIDAIHAGDHERAKAVLTNLSEPNETCLGKSKGRPRGRGVSGKQSFDLYEALRDSEAAKTGLLSEIADCDLFIPGIGPDKISDITTNVVRGPLVEYTQRQCELHGIALTANVPAGQFWDMDLNEWTGQYAELPIWRGRKIILVPKASVRFRMSIDSQEYYNHFVLDFLQSEHLRAGSALVKTFKGSGVQYVTKKSLKPLHPQTKAELYRFTKAHPHVLELYKKSERRERSALDKAIDGEIDTAALCDAMAGALRAIPAGTATASDFHNLMIGAIEFIFYPNLIYPVKEASINDGRKRIDITYTNAAREGFFFRLHTSLNIASNMVMVECKNYAGDIANPELDQLVGRFSLNRGRLGILIARTCSDSALFLKRCRDVAQAGNGVVVPIFDTDVIAMLDDIKQHRRQDIDARLSGILTRLIS